MKLSKITIRNFRGIKEADVLLDGHTVFVGDNNSGKSTIFDAVDLVLGPERMSQRPIIDEHDFYAGEYLLDNVSVEIFIEVIIVDLNIDQQCRFKNYIEWWNTSSKSIIEGPPAEATDGEDIVPALRLCFKGTYDIDEDDFTGQTYFSSSRKEDNTYEIFRTKDKRLCGFLYLRTLRTGNRALSLEHGSLLDIILRLRELRPQMWENVISQLHEITVAADPQLGISDILSSVQQSLHCFVPTESANNPCIRVSNLTREHLRKILTVFLDSGALCSDGSDYYAPYYHQGTGTVNVLVLSLLSIIAELKQNVIFAMEEPEIALPPHTQKRIIFSIISKSAQALFTSHSPYVLEEFDPQSVIVVSRKAGILASIPAGSPPNIKKKQYREELRKRFCESLLSRRVLITEGRTEYDVYTTVARKLQCLYPDKHFSLELLGFSVVNAETDSQVSALGTYYKNLGKNVFAVFDQQCEEDRANITQSVDFAYEAPEKGIENVVLNGTTTDALRRYAMSLAIDNNWPEHLSSQKPKTEMGDPEIKAALFAYFKWSKGSGSLADFLEQCEETELPKFIIDTIHSISASSTSGENPVEAPAQQEE